MRPDQAEYFVDLKRALENTPYRGRGSLIDKAASFLGVSRGVVYSRLQKVGWSAGRKVRSDCGKRNVDETLASLAGGLLRQATRANGKRILSIKRVTEILDANGRGCMIDGGTGEVTMPSPATLSRAMSAYGCHPEQTKRGSPHISLRSPHPNWCWQMDASVCVLFYLPRGKVRMMSETSYNKNKPYNLAKAEKARVIRWIVTDHRSDMFFVRYTLGNEDAENALNVLFEAMCKREAEGDILHGVPCILYTDKGAPFIANITKNVCTRLRIRLINHARGNARATGSGEVAQRIVETEFEGRLRFLQTKSLEELNSKADQWRITYNATELHHRHKKPRALLWSGITPDQLRVPQDVDSLRELVRTGETERTVSPRMTISYAPKGHGQQDYSLRLIDNISIGQKVFVAVNPYESPAVDVIVRDMDGTERIYSLSPIVKDSAGFDVNAPIIGEEFSRHRDTLTDKAIKRMDKEAYGVDTLEEAVKARQAGRRAYEDIDIMADVEARKVPLFFPVRGSALDTSAPAREALPLKIAAAGMRLMRMLSGAGVEWKEKHMEHLMAAYPGGTVPEEDIDGLAQRMIDDARPAEVIRFDDTLRRAAGGAA